MKDKICATLTKDHIYICSTSVIGRSGENECTQLEITLDECLCDKWVYIDFVKPDGTTYKTPKLDIVDNKVIYDIPNTLLDQKGTLKIQVVLQDETGEVWKSNIKTYGVNPSINATDDIPNQEDFITEAQRLLNEVEEGLTPTIGENGNWFVLDKDTGKPSRGIQGEPGVQGKPGSVKTIPVNEFPTENIEEDAIYILPNSNPTSEKDKYLEYVYVNGDWELFGGGSVGIDLTDYVKFTDYATYQKAGVVRAQSPYGISIPSDGYLLISKANQEEIKAKTSAYKPLVPSMLDYVILYGMTNNSLEWTDENKSSARELIGASADVTLTQDEYEVLVKTGTVTTSDGEIYTFDENTYYYIVEG